MESDESPLKKTQHPPTPPHQTAPSSSAPRSEAHDRTPHDKVYPCRFEGCRKVFDAPYKLENHSRTHTDERPYECSLEDCNRTFKWRSSLAQHQRQHMKRDGARPEDFAPARKRSANPSPAGPSAPDAGSVPAEFANPRAEVAAQRIDDQHAGGRGLTPRAESDESGDIMGVGAFIRGTKYAGGPLMKNLGISSPFQEEGQATNEPDVDSNRSAVPKVSSFDLPPQPAEEEEVASEPSLDFNPLFDM
mmetsp:Transcript_22851/g.56776  ORF Transcript_22851/g.56776 Transcript_22851/m.56776 type:complete len:247 (+) Transcript_22851:289-1029(+)